MGWSNRYWNAAGPFSHAKFGGYLVTRLDGYTEADAKALVARRWPRNRVLPTGRYCSTFSRVLDWATRRINRARINGTVILRESPWSDYNADMQKAHDLLQTRGIADELDLTETFIGGRTNLLGYFSWGSNDAKFSAAAYQTLSFSPGSIADTAVSTSGRTFLPTRGGQSLLVDLLRMA